MKGDASKREFAYYLKLQEKSLLQIIGQHQKVLAIGKIPDDHALAIYWYDRYEVLLYGKLCIEKNFCTKLIDQGFNDDITLGLAVADIICTCFVGIPPFVVSALLIKKGINKFCNCEEKLEQKRHRHLLTSAASWIRNLSADISIAKENGVSKKRISYLNSQKKTAQGVVRYLYRPEFKNILQNFEVQIPRSLKKTN